MADIGSVPGVAVVTGGKGGRRRGPTLSRSTPDPEGPSGPSARTPREQAAARPSSDDSRAAALAILARQRRDNPPRYALGLTTALVRETDATRRSAVMRRFGAFVEDLDGVEVVPGSALDQWRSIARGFAGDRAGEELVKRLRELTVPLGQAALATERTLAAGATSRPGGAVAAVPARREDEAPAPDPQAVWMDPRRPEQSKAEITTLARQLDDGALRRLHAATSALARAVPTDLAGEMRRSGYQRAASELAQIARTRGLAFDHVESEAARRRARSTDRGR